MKMYAEAAAFDDEKLVEDVEESAATATRYVQEISTDGIFVHQDDEGRDGKNPTDSTAYGVHISDDVDIIHGGKVVASYGEAATIGDEERSHAYLNDHSFQLFYGDEEDPYVHFSDLRDVQVTVTETFTGDGSTAMFTVTHSVYSVTSVEIDGEETTAYLRSSWTFSFNSALSSGSVLTITYVTTLAPMTDTFIGDGETTSFTVNYTVYSISSVRIDGTDTSAYSRSGRALTLTSAPSSGSVVEITYLTTNEVKAFTLGDRNSPVGTAIGNRSFAVGTANLASGEKSFAHGTDNRAAGSHSFASGYGCEASGSYSHAEGYNTTASGSYSHAEGYNTTASGHTSHAEGSYTTASGSYSRAEGRYTTASAHASHAEGYNTTASGSYSHAEGSYTTASGSYSHVEGKYNIIDNANKYAHIIGNGTSDSDRSNAFTVDWNGLLDSPSFGTVPRVSYYTLGGGSSGMTMETFMPAYLKYVMQNVIEASTDYANKVWMGVIVPSSRGIVIFNVYGPPNSEHMPQYGTGIYTNLGATGSAGTVSKFSIYNYVITLAAL